MQHPPLQCRSKLWPSQVWKWISCFCHHWVSRHILHDTRNVKWNTALHPHHGSSSTSATTICFSSQNKIFHGLPFVTVYVDDVLVHSATAEQHWDHLQQVFQRVREAGLTQKGKKCHIAMSAVYYLGHIFSRAGMSPDVQRSRLFKIGLLQL